MIILKQYLPTEHFYYLLVIIYSCFFWINVNLLLSGKRAFNHVHLDTEYRLVERPCSCKSRRCCCNWVVMHMFDCRFHSHQQVLNLTFSSNRNICFSFYRLFRASTNSLLFLFFNYRIKPEKSIRKQSINTARLLIAIASAYCLWCASQIYLINPPRPAVGEEADLGVILFLAVYFFLPHSLCIMSMHVPERLPL